MMSDESDTQRRLARVLDPAEIDALTGPHGKISISLASSAAEQETEIIVPKKVVCARCDGGGCDRCGRSGAIRLDSSDDDRKVRFMFPATAQDLRIRIVRPVAGLDLLTVEVRVTQSSALQIRRSDALALPTTSESLNLRSIVIAVALALAAAFAYAVAR